jgi:hypothetical protein
MIASPALELLVSIALPQPQSATDHLRMTTLDLAAPCDPAASVPNDVLAHSQGRGGLDLATVRSRQVADERSRADFQTFGMISRTQMDVWWGTTGPSLIASSIRSAGPAL